MGTQHDGPAPMVIHGIDHFTLRVRPSDVERLRDFYCEALVLREGARPPFSFPGHWLYASGHPIVHIAGNAADDVPATSAGARSGLDHISLRTSGLTEVRARLRGLEIDWHEAPVPGAPLHQVFLFDPTGLKIELTFDAAELARAEPFVPVPDA